MIPEPNESECQFYWKKSNMNVCLGPNVVPDCYAPKAPSVVQIPSDNQNFPMTLSWSQPAILPGEEKAYLPPAKYMLEFSTVGRGSVSIPVAGDKNSYQINYPSLNMPPAGSIDIRVKAVSSCGLESSTVNAGFLCDTYDAPSPKLTKVTPTAKSGQNITLEWVPTSKEMIGHRYKISWYIRYDTNTGSHSDDIEQNSYCRGITGNVCSIPVDDMATKVAVGNYIMFKTLHVNRCFDIGDYTNFATYIMKSCADEPGESADCKRAVLVDPFKNENSFPAPESEEPEPAQETAESTVTTTTTTSTVEEETETLPPVSIDASSSAAAAAAAASASTVSEVSVTDVAGVDTVPDVSVGEITDVVSVDTTEVPSVDVSVDTAVTEVPDVSVGDVSTDVSTVETSVEGVDVNVDDVSVGDISVDDVSVGDIGVDDIGVDDLDVDNIEVDGIGDVDVNLDDLGIEGIDRRT